MEPLPGADPGWCPYRGLPVPDPGASLPARPGLGTPGCLLAPPIGALFSLVRTPGGIRTRKYTPLKRARLPVAARAHKSRPPVSTRIIRRTKAEPQAVRGGVVPLPRFELGTSWTRPKRCCQVELEGIEYGRRESNAQAAHFEWARSARLPSLPRAPPGSRTPFLRVRAGCITRHACSAKSLTGESNPASQFGGLAHRRNACKARWVPPEPNRELAGFDRS
jgi:hypothetical protein